MFDIINSQDFYQKLLEDFDDYMQQQDSARRAMNCAITAHHLADWVWGDFVKGDTALKSKLGIKDKSDFMGWIDSQTVWYGLVQSISNGSKHFIRENAKGTQKVAGFGMGGYGQGPFGMSYLAIEVSQTEPKNMPLSMLFEVVIRFWRDFFRAHGPYPLGAGPRSRENGAFDALVVAFRARGSNSWKKVKPSDFDEVGGPFGCRRRAAQCQRKSAGGDQRKVGP